MNFRCILSGLIAAATLSLSAFASPARDGFGVRRNFYMSGRLSAKVSDIAGVFEVNYIGRQPYRALRFYSSNENCTWGRFMVPQVIVDGKRYRLPFDETRHYSFGYSSTCEVAGVKLRHQLVLDHNAVFRRVTVLDNPEGKEVRAACVQMNAGLQRFRLRMNDARDGLLGSREDNGAVTSVEVGSLNPASLPLNDRPERPLAFGTNPEGETRTQSMRFDLVEREPSDEHLFWMVFNRTPGEELSVARVESVFAEDARRRAGDAKFDTGDPVMDDALESVMPTAAAMEVDRTGAFRASPTYWVWGWDAMVHAGPLAMTGRAEEVKRMLEFFERVADQKKGILHSYNETFRYSGDGSTGPGGSLVLPPHVQLFYVVLLHDYWCLTGDDALRDRLLPFARRLVERALAVPVNGERLCREYGFFPDNPYAVDQRHDDISLINNAIYYQGLCAYNALAGGLDAECEAVRRELVAKLWDPKEGYWSDAWDVSAGARRAHYPLYGLFAVSPFGLEAWPCGMSAAADYMKSRFFLGDRLAMFSPGTQSHLADGNQLGAYYPVADRTYWNVMNAASRVDALADLRHILTSHWKVMTYPEGQCADVVNGDPSDYSDELGNKQFFAAKSWLCDALELNLGLRWSTKGLSFHAIGDGRPFAVSNLSLRGGKLAIRRTGSGTCAKYIINGRPLEGAFLPWSALTGDDRVDIVCFAEDDLVKWVDPLIGTAGEGNTIPGSAYPFGMVQPGPDSGTGTNCSGYKHGDGTIRGISQTHLNGTGCAGMGDILLMPYTGETDGIDFSSPFSGQTCSPDRYSVSFDRFGTRAESTCSEHVSWLRFSYPDGASRKVFLDCASTLRMPWRAKNGPAVPESSFVLSDDRMEVYGSRTVVGWTTYTLHYVVRFDSPWTEARRQPSNAAEARGDRFELAFAPGRPLVARVALSTVSVEGARRNLDAESAGMDFESVVAANRAAWNGLLSRAVVEEGSDEQKASWYTALYRLCIQPNNIADVDGSYRGDDGRVARAKCGRYYSTLSLWDTFRAAHPLYTLVAPERVDGFVETMVLHGEAHGHLPVWPLWGRESHDMIGVHSIPVLVDAWAKGFRPVSGERILELAVKSMTTCDEEWNELAWNITWENGYIPYEPGVFDRFHVRHGNVSRTLEHAYDWWCISHLAGLLGDVRGRRDAAKWAGSWRNVFDESVGFVRPRGPKTSGGRFLEPFDPRAPRAPGEFWSDYTEANSWVYTWHVMQDPEGLVEAMGGRDRALAKLDEFFSTPPLVGGNRDEGGAAADGSVRPGQIGQYWHGNEPSHHVIYLYSLLGRRDRAAKLVREVCEKAYRAKPDGLCGNDDCGQMSAWYVFSAMGFYPFNPCDGGYVLGEAQIPRVRIALPGGKTLVVRVDPSAPESVLFNGKRVEGACISHGELLSGGELVFGTRR